MALIAAHLNAEVILVVTVYKAKFTELKRKMK